MTLVPPVQRDFFFTITGHCLKDFFPYQLLIARWFYLPARRGSLCKSVQIRGDKPGQIKVFSPIT
jgi:hypothetical protein